MTSASRNRDGLDVADSETGHDRDGGAARRPEQLARAELFNGDGKSGLTKAKRSQFVTSHEGTDEASK
jgi:hypothetical protein